MITTTASATTTETLTAATTSGAATLECQDFYTKNCSVDFAGRCSDPVVGQVCQKTCGLCVVPTTPPALECQDLYIKNCSVDFAGRCSDPVVGQVCQKTCGLCVVPTTPPGCVDLLPNATCSEPQMVSACSQQHVRDACPATCDACPGQGQGSSATHAPPPLTSTTTTPTTPTILSCRQCGNYGNGTACTNEELLFDDLKPCDDVTASFCMTDAIVDVNSQVSIYKRCVSHRECENEWYRQTSDKAACLNFDPSSVTPDLACHFCCVGVGCNADIVPPRDVQWRP